MAEDVGICEINSDGEIIRLEKQFYGQGTIFKSWDAYKNRPSDPCYQQCRLAASRDSYGGLDAE